MAQVAQVAQSKIQICKDVLKQKPYSIVLYSPFCGRFMWRLFSGECIKK